MPFNLADLLIIVVLAVTTITAFIKGFFVEAFSLVGVILGLFIAAANYATVAVWVVQVVHNQPAANLIAFLTISFLVMLVASVLGRSIRGVLRKVGLGIFDRLLGACFGFLKGSVVVTLILMGIVAFVPRQDWLIHSRLAPIFLDAVHGSLRVVPFTLGEEIRRGLDALRFAQPDWVKPGSSIQ